MKRKQEILEYIDTHPYTESDAICDELDVKKNVVNRILGILEDEEKIIWETDPNSFGTHGYSCSLSYTSGWIISKPQQIIPMKDKL